jgi:hypothetical protein
MSKPLFSAAARSEAEQLQGSVVVSVTVWVVLVRIEGIEA